MEEFMKNPDKNQGWIKLHRQIQDNELWFSERFTKVQAWIDLLLLANHKPTTIFIRGVEINLERGQLAYSQVTLAHRWGWNERTVKRFLQMFEKRGMIQSKTTNISTIITVSNYQKYQEYTEQNTKLNAERVQSKIQTDNNDNKDNNEKKNIYVEDKNKKEPGEQSEVVNDILEYFESTLKTKIVLRGRESKAIRDMLNVGYSENGIKNAIKYMHENDEYFKDKPFDLFDVARQMPRYKAQGEKIKAEREALNTEFTNKKPQVRYEEVKDERGRVINYKEVYSEE